MIINFNLTYYIMARDVRLAASSLYEINYYAEQYIQDTYYK